MTELQEQVATLLSIVSRNTETIAALQVGKADAEATAENFRQRLAQVLARAVARNQRASLPKPPPARRSSARARPAKAKTQGRRVASDTRPVAEIQEAP